MAARPLTVAACALAFLWVAIVVVADGAVQTFVEVGGRLPIMLIALYAGWHVTRAQTERRWRRAWGTLTAAMLSLTIGDVFVTYDKVVRGVTPEFMVSDLFYLLYFALILLGLFALPRVFKGRLDRLKLLLDGLIVTFGGGLLVWWLAVEPVLAAGSEHLSLKDWVNLMLPFGDLLTLVGISVAMMRLPPGRMRRTFVLIGMILVASFAGDVAFGIAELLERPPLRTVANSIWLLQPVLFAAAAERELRRSHARDSAIETWAPAFQGLPYAGLLLGYGTIAVVASGADSAAMRWLMFGAVLLTVFVVLRQALAQRENALLLAENIRRRGEARFRALIEHASDAILILDRALHVTYASPGAERALGLVANTAQARLTDYLHPADAETLVDYAAACLRGEVRSSTVMLRFEAGTNVWRITEATLSNLLSEPDVDGIVLNLRDVTDRQALEDQLRFQAFHDPLTGLANRELFIDRVQRALLRARAGEAIALAIVDLDRFKLVNDGLGHRKGDRVLATTGTRLAAILSGADSAARLGGDEFGVLLEHVERTEDALQRLDNVRTALAAPIALDGQEARVTVSIGVVIDSGTRGTETLVRDADIALQRARTMGGNAVELFRAERDTSTIERITLEAGLPALLQSNAFALRYEPIVRVADERVFGLSLVLAWRDAATATPIERVIEVANASGHSVELARWMRSQLLADLRSLQRYIPEASELAILMALDAAQLRDPRFSDEIAEFVQKLDVPASQLVYLVGAGTFAADVEETKRPLARLRELGLGIGLADFGAGQGSFELLEAVPADFLELSESLVERVEKGERPGALVRAAIATGRALGLRVIAPGVATAKQMALLSDLGCELAHGPHIVEPMSYESVLPWLGGRYAAAKLA
jgi:diguanylate cyclase (GGDEF)-like protein/PAS domain S-box-containing protein